MPSFLPARIGFSALLFALFCSPALSLTGALGPQTAQAATTAIDTTLTSVQTLTARLDEVSNRQDLSGLLQFYSLEFTNSDGLNRQTLEQSIQQFWKQYPKLLYRTEVLSAQPKGKGIEAETLTNITGKQLNGGREWQIEMFVRSRQTWEGNKLVQQEILSEQTRTSMGNNPPVVTVKLPETVQVGERFDYEAIVEEPLGSDILMGEILAQPVTTKAYTNPPQLLLDLPSVLELVGERSFLTPTRPSDQQVRIKLKRMRAGGFFKSFRAPQVPENRWLSAVLMRHDSGVTIVTQRLRVLK